MTTTIVSLKPAQVGHRLFVCITSEHVFAEGNTHTVLSLCRPMGGTHIRFRSWINSHPNTGIEWDKTTKHLNFGEEIDH